MSDTKQLKLTLKKLGIEDRYDEVINKSNKFGPTTKFDKNGNLVRLDISEMGIEELPEDAFAELNHLEELKLFKNNIKELPETVFDNLSKLSELHLKDNQIKEISARHFEKLDNLNRLFLLGNPLGDKAKVYPNKVAVDTFIKILKNE